ncbi:palmitoyltransferase pfa5 [Tulasnella sp. JGI-2019a]|nr:palmitoyltransferase pfa5 [Tulasnella sp. JGI-2019a]
MDVEVSSQPTKKELTANTNQICGSGPRKPLKSFREVNEEHQRKRANRNKPPPWISRKLPVFITLALIIFATYVYVGRACIPMIRQDVGALGKGRGMGVAFMVIFWILWIMNMWTYIKIIVTPPGFARDYVEKVPPPTTTVAGPRYPSFRGWDAESDGSIDPYHYQSHDDSENNSTNRAMASNGNVRGSTSMLPSPISAVSANHRNSGAEDTTPRTDTVPLEVAGASQVPEEAHELHAFPPVAALHADRLDINEALRSSDLPAAPPLDRNSSGLSPKTNTRQPPPHPTLAPEYRYCHKEGFVKPIRAHHCRICATCVLNYDHHCPWIGGCVGARNRKFFVNFCGWGCIFCFWIFTTLIAINAQATGPYQSLDPLQLVIIVIAGLFGLFTLSLVLQHIRQLAYNLSTVESYGITSMRQRENYTLSKMFPWWNASARNRQRREWDREWGALYTEGNIWWLGSSRRNWEQVMGKDPWGWICELRLDS